MKTIVLSIALMMAGSTAMFATSAQDQDPVATTVQAPAEEGYKEVELKDLNENVQAAVNSLSEVYTIKALAYHAEKKLTKVSLVSKVDEKESVVILDNEGKAVE